MENKKQILSMQLNVDDFAPASDSEKESLSVMRESVSFWKDGLRRLRKNPIAMVSLAVLIIVLILAFIVPAFYPYDYATQIRGSENLGPMQYSEAEQAAMAAGEKVFPHILGTDSLGRDYAVRVMMGTRVSLSVGLLASVLVLLSPVMELAGFDGFFWIFFSMNIVFLLISYIPMFPAFLKLRSVDPAANRVFKVPGGRGVALVVAWVPVILLVLAIIATIVPLNGSEAEMSKIPMLIGVIAFVILGELVRIWWARGRKDDYGGMGSSGDPFEFDVAHGYEEMPESEKIAVEEDLLIGREPRDLV